MAKEDLVSTPAQEKKPRRVDAYKDVWVFRAGQAENRVKVLEGELARVTAELAKAKSRITPPWHIAVAFFVGWVLCS